MNARKFFLLVPVVAAVFAAAACSDDSDNDPDPKPGNNADAGADGATDAGLQPLPADATKVVASIKGGFEAPVGDASTCQPADTTYTLTLPARALTWKVCELTDVDAGDRGPTFAFTEGEKSLTEAEYAPLEAAISGMQRSTEAACGADKPVQLVAVTSPSGTVTYEDEFYACNGGSNIYVTGVDAVMTQFRTLTTP